MQKKTKNNVAAPCGEELLNLLSRQNRPMRLDAIIRATGLSRACRINLKENLQALADEGRLARLPGGLWSLPEKLHTVAGVFRALNSGAGYVTTVSGDGKTRELFVPSQHTGGAWHKDVVRVMILPGSGSAQGKVMQIVQRGYSELPAVVIKRQGKSVICRPADRRIKTNFSAHMETAEKLDHRIKPGILLSLHPEKEIGPNLWEAKILNIYGAENQVDVQEALVKLSHHVPGDFPRLALEQAAALPPAPDRSDMASREDCRHMPFVTIDGADARDFDDAIHVEKRDNGWILRVAIADVSHYVQPDNRPESLDAEALRRGNSWYFPRSVEPMLPQALSNGLCSLRPHEDRLAMLVEIPLDTNGQPGEPRFARIVMRSAARLVYDDVAEFFSHGPQATANHENFSSPVCAMLQEAFALYKKLSRNRKARGTLDFDLPEPQYAFNDEGKLTGMTTRQRNDAHMLIEEFMIAANEAVASFLESKGVEFLYRVHPAPEQAKLAALFETLKSAALESLPPDIQKNGIPDPDALQQILARAAGTPQEYVVNRLCLRSMPQARYQAENSGHFGLASRAYCHFTSPIRRYADLMVHRALKSWLDKKGGSATATELDDTGQHLNALEREAAQCEREMAKRLACIALQGNVGELIRGTVSGVTDFGIFVEFAHMPAEGLIRLEDLSDDWYELDEQRQCLVGQRTGQIWRLGQSVTARISKVDLERIDICLAPVSRDGQSLTKRDSGRKNRKDRSKKTKSGKRTAIPPQSPTRKRRTAAGGKSSLKTGLENKNRRKQPSGSTGISR